MNQTIKVRHALTERELNIETTFEDFEAAAAHVESVMPGWKVVRPAPAEKTTPKVK